MYALLSFSHREELTKEHGKPPVLRAAMVLGHTTAELSLNNSAHYLQCDLFLLNETNTQIRFVCGSEAKHVTGASTLHQTKKKKNSIVSINNNRDVCLSVCLSVYLSVYVSIFLAVCLSLSLSD